MLPWTSTSYLIVPCPWKSRWTIFAKVPGTIFQTLVRLDISWIITLLSVWCMHLFHQNLTIWTAYLLVYPNACVTSFNACKMQQHVSSHALKKYEHITPVLVNLHWLPIKQRIDYKIALITLMPCMVKLLPTLLNSFRQLLKQGTLGPMINIYYSGQEHPWYHTVTGPFLM